MTLRRKGFIHVNGGKLATVRADSVQIDREYQRALKRSHALDIGHNFDRKRFGYPLVSLRKDGTMVAVDGQHRIIGLCETGQGAMMITVQIVEGLSLAEEALLFYNINIKGIWPVSAIDGYRALLAGKDPVVLEINRIMRRLGLTVTSATGRDNVVAVRAIEYAHGRNSNLEPTMSALKSWSDGYDGDPVAYDNRVIRHVSGFLVHFPAADTDVLAVKLTKYGSPPKFVAKVRSKGETYGALPASELGENILVELYNKRNRRKLKPSDRVDGPPPRRAPKPTAAAAGRKASP